MRSDKGTKGVVVTGAAGGIGQAIVRRCVNDGYFVFAFDCDFGDAAWKAIAADRDSQVSEVRVDLSKAHQIARAFEKVRKTGIVVCHLINNAGVYPAQGLADYTTEDIERVISINLNGAVHCCTAFVALPGGGSLDRSIVNMSSIAGQLGSHDPVYGSTKAALIGLTKSLARGLAPHIRVNAIAPGTVTTEAFRRLSPARRKAYLSSDLLQAPITPDDVAGTVAFLLGPDGKHYTGAVFDLNNGCGLR